MKYEEWIKYEQARQDLSDKLAWVSYSDLPTKAESSPIPAAFLQPYARPPKQSLWINLYQRFLSRRI